MPFNFSVFKMKEILEIINDYNQKNNSTLTIDDISIDIHSDCLFVIYDGNGDLIRLSGQIVVFDGLFLRCSESNQIIPLTDFVLKQIEYDEKMYYISYLDDCMVDSIEDFSSHIDTEIDHRIFSSRTDDIAFKEKIEIEYDKSWIEDFLYFRNKPIEIYDNIEFFKRTVKRVLSLQNFQEKLKKRIN